MLGRQVAAAVGDHTAAQLLYERLAPWPSSVASTQSLVSGAVAHYLGHLATVLGRYDTAEAHFTQALAIHERLEAPFHIARTHLEWGRMLIARGQRDNAQVARAHLESALDLAQRYGRRPRRTTGRRITWNTFDPPVPVGWRRGGPTVGPLRGTSDFDVGSLMALDAPAPQVYASIVPSPAHRWSYPSHLPLLIVSETNPLRPCCGHPTREAATR